MHRRSVAALVGAVVAGVVLATTHVVGASAAPAGSTPAGSTPAGAIPAGVALAGEWDSSLPGTPVTPQEPCVRVSFVIGAAWPNGYVLNIVLTNCGTTPVSGVQVSFTLPNCGYVTQGWNATWTVSGCNVTLVYYGTIPPGGSVYVGAIVSGPPSTYPSLPTSCTVNGRPCVTG